MSLTPIRDRLFIYNWTQFTVVNLRNGFNDGSFIKNYHQNSFAATNNYMVPCKFHSWKVSKFICAKATKAIDFFCLHHSFFKILKNKTANDVAAVKWQRESERVITKMPS